MNIIKSMCTALCKLLYYQYITINKKVPGEFRGFRFFPGRGTGAAAQGHPPKPPRLGLLKKFHAAEFAVIPVSEPTPG